eukprot:TRINITY_DN5640_c0_g1_i1.p1 TRINITY_DN5640_c0_g1~~TRINITY_DN5640_c0_g1_i1.p1  ORF type:complete len:286 (-),score=37.24 TRINITY_DN5640_c0_g1_i1:21-878(-)
MSASGRILLLLICVCIVGGFEYVPVNIVELWDNRPWNAYPATNSDPDFDNDGMRSIITWDTKQDYQGNVSQTFDSAGIDDFIVPSNKTWYITEFYFSGFFLENDSPVDYKTLQGMRITLYKNTEFDTPDDIPFITKIGLIPYRPFTSSSDDIHIPLDPPLVLNGSDNGTRYWLSVAVENIAEWLPTDHVGIEWYWYVHWRSVANSGYFKSNDTASLSLLSDYYPSYPTDNLSFWWSVFGEEIETGTDHEESSYFSSEIDTSESVASSDSGFATRLTNFLSFLPVH